MADRKADRHQDPEIKAAILIACEQALLTGNWTREVEDRIAAANGVHVRTVRRMRQVVEAGWRRSMLARDYAAERSDWLQRMRHLQHVAMEAGDVRTAERCLRTEARVLGLEAPVQVDLQVTSGHLGQLTDEQLRSAIEEREAEVRRLGAIDVPCIEMVPEPEEAE